MKNKLSDIYWPVRFTRRKPKTWFKKRSVGLFVISKISEAINRRHMADAHRRERGVLTLASFPAFRRLPDQIVWKPTNSEITNRSISQGK